MHPLQFLCLGGIVGTLLAAPALGAPATWIGQASTEEMVTVYPREFRGGIENPLKGFRPDKGLGKPYCTVFRRYLKWNDLEKGAGDSLERILYVTRRATEESGKRFADHNSKLVPRVYLDWSGRAGQQYWPADLHVGDYESPAFNQRLLALIAKLGRAWDEDPRIYAVQMGLIGFWGEHHTPGPTAEQRHLLAEAFRRAFRHKPVLVRMPLQEFAEAGFGIYYDTFATLSREPETPGAQKDFPSLAHTEYPDLWKRAPIEGEVEYNWQQQRPTAKPENTFGRTPDETMTNPRYRQYMIGKIRRYHASYLGWIANFDPNQPDVVEGAGEIQKALGYRFVLERFDYTPRVAPGGALALRFSVRNTGSAPFYLDWPVAVALLDKDSHRPVWQTTLQKADLRQWLPGEHWDETKAAYTSPAARHEVAESVILPTTLPAGEYLVALAILDRQGGLRPSARFACANYVPGGWHPLAIVGVGRPPSRTEPDPSIFSSPAFDHTLAYSVPEHLARITEPPALAVTAITSWKFDISGEILDPHRFWDVRSTSRKTERKVTFDGPMEGPAGAKVITAHGEFDGGSLVYLLPHQTKLPAGRYRLSFLCRGTDGLRLLCAWADGWKPLPSDGPGFVVTPRWERQELVLTNGGDFKEGTVLVFRLPKSGRGDFSVTDYHLRKIE